MDRSLSTGDAGTMLPAVGAGDGAGDVVAAWMSELGPVPVVEPAMPPVAGASLRDVFRMGGGAAGLREPVDTDCLVADVGATRKNKIHERSSKALWN